MADEHGELRLMSDYGCTWPLWCAELGGGLSDLHATLGTSRSLEQDLLAWQEHFEVHFDFMHGWTSPRAADDYSTAGAGLLDRLRNELPDKVVTMNLWPTEK